MAGGPPPDIAAAIAGLIPPGRVPDNELVPGRMYKLFNIYGSSWVTVMFVGLMTDDGDTWYMLRNPADGIEYPTLAATSPLYRIVDLLAKNAWKRRGSAVAAYAKRVEAEEAEAEAAANGGHANGGLPNNANRNKNKGSNTKKNKRRSSARKHRKTRRH